jgi:hypothetical protein
MKKEKLLIFLQIGIKTDKENFNYIIVIIKLVEL